MTDLINQLRTTASKGISVWGDLQMEAANQIESLTAERDALRDTARLALDALEPGVSIYFERRDAAVKALKAVL